jgi:hypothetical protein
MPWWNYEDQLEMLTRTRNSDARLARIERRIEALQRSVGRIVDGLRAKDILDEIYDIEKDDAAKIEDALDDSKPKQKP